MILNCSKGKVSIFRKEETVWSADIKTGEKNITHSLENLEYHHFKYAGHRIPLQAHVHFFGADAFSYGKGIKLLDGDIMQVEWKELGRPLRNTVKIVKEEEKLLKVNSF